MQRLASGCSPTGGSALREDEKREKIAGFSSIQHVHTFVAVSGWTATETVQRKLPLIITGSHGLRVGIPTQSVIRTRTGGPDSFGIDRRGHVTNSRDLEGDTSPARISTDIFIF